MNIQANKNARAYAKAETTIDATASKVYNTIADINRWPEWQSAVSSAKLEGKLEEGVTFNWKANGMKIKSKLHTVKKDSAIGWTGKMFWIKAIHNWRFTEENGTTKVIVEESMSGFGSSMMRKTLRKGMELNLIELKDRVL